MKNDQYIIETLSEFGNISSGNAATTIAQLMNTKLTTSLTDVAFVSKEDLSQIIDEEQCISILLPIKGDLDGMIIFLFTPVFAQRFLQELMKCDINSHMFQDEELDVLEEAASIMASAYMEGIASCLHASFRIEPPHIAIDMKGSILNDILAMCIQHTGTSIMLHTAFSIDEHMPNDLIFLIQDDCVERLYKAMEIRL